MSKKIVISGWYGFGNIGDEAILQAMIDTFGKEYPNCQITVLSYKPEYTKRVQQVNAVYQIPIHGIKTWIKNILLLRWVPTLKAIKDCDIFVMGGGGFLSDWQPEVPKGWLKQMKLAKFFGKKTMLYGIGAGPFLTEKGKKETKYYIDNFVDEVTVRDSESYKKLTEIANVNSEKVKLTNDPVTKWDLDKYKKNKVVQNTIGVILTPHFDRPIWKDNEVRWPKLFECYTSMLNDLIANGKKIKLIFFQDNYENDFSINLKNSLDDKNIDIIFPTNLNSAIETLSECEGIISFRLHGNILAYALDKPFLPIIYHHKTAGFLNNIVYLKEDCILEVGEGLNWKDLPIKKDDWINKSRLFTQYVENKEKFFEK